jgi:hypothetical protein
MVKSSLIASILKRRIQYGAIRIAEILKKTYEIPPTSPNTSNML